MRESSIMAVALVLVVLPGKASAQCHYCEWDTGRGGAFGEHAYWGGQPPPYANFYIDANYHTDWRPGPCTSEHKACGALSPEFSTALVLTQLGGFSTEAFESLAVRFPDFVRLNASTGDVHIMGSCGATIVKPKTSSIGLGDRLETVARQSPFRLVSGYGLRLS